ncbi:CGNR zinc finger domain-containing protein [Kitasatospora sp. NPDC057015]|uniref:CGNR zinc finger domain-containing protein n=1 Tax=Kitasatospora sp. NPDC057015 TaxID=3346001 RepID=UPI00363A6DF5
MDGGGMADAQEPEQARSVADGMPLTGEPLALELVNTTFVRGGLRGALIDALRTPDDLDGWLADREPLFSEPLRTELPGAAATEGHLARFLELRQALRDLAAAHVAGRAPAGPPVDLLNASAPLAACWLQLAPAADGPARAVTRRAEPDPHLAALGEVATAGIALFAGEAADRIRACPAPGCILYFVQSHRRREWCTVACGNRVRVARHSRRAKGDTP